MKKYIWMWIFILATLCSLVFAQDDIWEELEGLIGEYDMPDLQINSLSLSSYDDVNLYAKVKLQVYGDVSPSTIVLLTNNTNRSSLSSVSYTTTVADQITTFVIETFPIAKTTQSVITFTIDPDDTIDESNENNNTITVSNIFKDALIQQDLQIKQEKERQQQLELEAERKRIEAARQLEQEKLLEQQKALETEKKKLEEEQQQYLKAGKNRLEEAQRQELLQQQEALVAERKKIEAELQKATKQSNLDGQVEDLLQDYKVLTMYCHYEERILVDCTTAHGIDELKTKIDQMVDVFILLFEQSKLDVVEKKARIATYQSQIKALTPLYIDPQDEVRTSLRVLFIFAYVDYRLSLYKVQF